MISDWKRGRRSTLWFELRWSSLDLAEGTMHPKHLLTARAVRASMDIRRDLGDRCKEASALSAMAVDEDRAVWKLSALRSKPWWTEMSTVSESRNSIRKIPLLQSLLSQGLVLQTANSWHLKSQNHEEQICWKPSSNDVLRVLVRVLAILFFGGPIPQLMLQFSSITVFKSWYKIPLGPPNADTDLIPIS